MKTPYLIAAAAAVTLTVSACTSAGSDLKTESAQAATTATPTTAEAPTTSAAPTTTEISCGPGEHRTPINTCEADPTTTPAPTTTIPTFAVDPAVAVASAFAQGVPALTCVWPAAIQVPQQMTCPVVNADQSEGTWSFTLNTDMSVTGAAYAETKAPPPPPPQFCGPDSYINVDGNCVPRPVSAPSAPAGATAQCQDGTYSFSQHRQGTCSHHGGVAQWL